MEEPERGEENEIDSQAVEGECPLAVSMSPGEKAAVKAKFKETFRDPRKRTSYQRGPRADLSGITIISGAHPVVPEADLGVLRRTRASIIDRHGDCGRARRRGQLEHRRAARVLRRDRPLRRGEWHGVDNHAEPLVAGTAMVPS